MGTRVAGIRQRPLDHNKPLPIARTVEELDNSQQLFRDPAPGEGSGQVSLTTPLQAAMFRLAGASTHSMLTNIPHTLLLMCATARVGAVGSTSI
jgi:hypothetical protein